MPLMRWRMVTLAVHVCPRMAMTYIITWVVLSSILRIPTRMLLMHGVRIATIRVSAVLRPRTITVRSASVIGRISSIISPIVATLASRIMWPIGIGRLALWYSSAVRGSALSNPSLVSPTAQHREKFSSLLSIRGISTTHLDTNIGSPRLSTLEFIHHFPRILDIVKLCNKRAAEAASSKSLERANSPERRQHASEIVDADLMRQIIDNHQTFVVLGG
mmetsp:Transcript_5868/g.12079  ORF Transcript_5868/g.12079 Transcript_5868/m.12079 type:complete len:218 (+) Transcript_5868:742-1395(+)